MNRNLTIEDAGKKCTCDINYTQISDGKIQYCKNSITGHKFFICQNDRDGATVWDRFGYKYSFGVGDGSAFDLNRWGIKNLEVCYEDLKLADIENDVDLLINKEQKE